MATLLCVTGLSPQVITETLYALIRRGSAGHLPERIVVVTTARGKELINNELIDTAGPRYLSRLLEDNGLDCKAVTLEPEDIHVIHDPDGQPLDDIRSEADNEAAADLICRVVRRLTDRPEHALHASIAGGRKTMGFYLGHAMSLFARPGDEVSHVLVNPPFENHPDFYFPPREVGMLRVNENGRVRRLRTDQAKITLAPIPIVRLRHSLPPELLDPAASYSEAIAMAQRSLDPPRLVIDIDQGVISCSGKRVHLPAAQLALLAWMAERIRSGRGGLLRRDIADHADEILDWRARVSGPHSGSTERLEQALKAGGFGQSDFDSLNSRLRKNLDRHLGRELARRYRIAPRSGRRLQPYVIDLEPDQIEFSSLPPT